MMSTMILCSLELFFTIHITMLFGEKFVGEMLEDVVDYDSIHYYDVYDNYYVSILIEIYFLILRDTTPL